MDKELANTRPTRRKRRYKSEDMKKHERRIKGLSLVMSQQSSSPSSSSSTSTTSHNFHVNLSTTPPMRQPLFDLPNELTPLQISLHQSPKIEKEDTEKMLLKTLIEINSRMASLESKCDELLRLVKTKIEIEGKKQSDREDAPV